MTKKKKLIWFSFLLFLPLDSNLFNNKRKRLKWVGESFYQFLFIVPADISYCYRHLPSFNWYRSQFCLWNFSFSHSPMQIQLWFLSTSDCCCFGIKRNESVVIEIILHEQWMSFRLIVFRSRFAVNSSLKTFWGGEKVPEKHFSLRLYPGRCFHESLISMPKREWCRSISWRMGGFREFCDKVFVFKAD